MYIYIYEEKLKNNQKFNNFFMKVDVERFGYKDSLLDFKLMKTVVKHIHRYFNHTFL